MLPLLKDWGGCGVGAAIRDSRQSICLCMTACIVWRPGGGLTAIPVVPCTGLPQRYLGLSAWLWAASTLMSRTMYVPFDAAGRIRFQLTV